MGTNVRNLVLVLGDQLDADNTALDGFDPALDQLWMAEVREETEHVWAHKLRIAAFFSAMRHFRDEQRARGRTVAYTELPEDPAQDRAADFGALLRLDLRRLRPKRVVLARPGDHRVLTALRGAAQAQGIGFELREGRHFFLTPETFAARAQGRSRVLLETFYREMRRRFGVLLTPTGAPLGGRWNFDEENRASFGAAGPGPVPPLPRFPPDEVTRAVVRLVARRFSDHPGRLDPEGQLDVPVTAAQARVWLDDFVEHRLPRFGRFEDAMWSSEPVLHHSRLSFPLNLQLLKPRDCLSAAVAAHAAGKAPLASVEGFVRQVLGWRELVHGVYWARMPGYADENALGCPDRPVPASYWNGETDMACVRAAMSSVLTLGYTHHIQRLMVLGLFALLLGVHPRRFHEWHLAMYVDAVDWASLPNALGMSQYGDGGVVATKPYVASASYIARMSNHCAGCRYDPHARTGEDACPFNSLYWDFLARHRDRLATNPRMRMQVANLDRKSPGELVTLRRRADVLRDRVDAGGRL